MGIRDRTEAAKDSFWTWRDIMYRFVGQLTPDDLEAISAQLYVEMLKSGYTAVGEFQYLHHDRDGTPFTNLIVGRQESIHGSYRTQILPLFQELGIDLRRGQIHKAWVMQRRQDLLLFSIGQSVLRPWPEHQRGSGGIFGLLAIERGPGDL